MMGAGNSTRFGLHVKKQWLWIDTMPLWQFVTKNLASMYDFDKIVVAGNKNELFYMEKFDDFLFCEGGNTRQESLKNALLHVKSEYVLVSDIARACIDKKLVLRIIAKKEQGDCIAPTLNVVDTVHFENKSINREGLKRIQTPQLSKASMLKTALKTKQEFTDDSSAILAVGGSVVYVDGEISANKLTCKDDLESLSCLEKPSRDVLIGSGFDVHEFGVQRPLILGGVRVHESMGLKAHSDGDVVVHSLIDSILGAMGAGDIGELFPDCDDKYRDVDSMRLLEKVYEFMVKVGYEIVNCDITIIAQTPKIGSFKKDMQKVLAKALHVKPIRVNVKATTTEKLGFVGREEGIAALSSVSLKFYDWTSR